MTMTKLAFNTFLGNYRDAIAKKHGDQNVGTFWGNQYSKIVHISQAPSLSVIQNKQPFSDKSGEKLRNEWYKISYDQFYNPNNFYITAIGMYYPGKMRKVVI